jgi:hypothetical protein
MGAVRRGASLVALLIPLGACGAPTENAEVVPSATTGVENLEARPNATAPPEIIEVESGTTAGVAVSSRRSHRC